MEQGGHGDALRRGRVSTTRDTPSYDVPVGSRHPSQEIPDMFGLFRKDPSVKLRARYAKMLEEARDLQRKGDIRNFALKTAEAEEVLKQIQALGDQRS
jgi:hypothetical protein